MRNALLFLVLTIAAALVGNLVLTSQTIWAPNAKAATSASNHLLQKGIEELENSNLAGAIRLFEQAVTANPKNARAFSYLGQGYGQVGNTTRAYKYYGIALDIDPNEVKALSWSGQVDLRNDRFDLAGRKLVRLERVCGLVCPEYQSLKDVLDNLDPKD